jgi:hypothetical protein
VDSDSDIIFEYPNIFLNIGSNPDIFSDIGFGYKRSGMRRISDIRSDNPDSEVG